MQRRTLPDYLFRCVDDVAPYSDEVAAAVAARVAAIPDGDLPVLLAAARMWTEHTSTRALVGEALATGSASLLWAVACVHAQVPSSNAAVAAESMSFDAGAVMSSMLAFASFPFHSVSCDCAAPVTDAPLVCRSVTLTGVDDVRDCRFRQWAAWTATSCHVDGFAQVCSGAPALAVSAAAGDAGAFASLLSTLLSTSAG